MKIAEETLEFRLSRSDEFPTTTRKLKQKPAIRGCYTTCPEKMSEQAMIPYYLPEEIFLQIFRNLPVKSLGKCMCVCKAWNCLIKNPSFISTHLNKQLEKSSRNNSDNLFLVMSRDPGNEFKMRYFLQFDDQEFIVHLLAVQRVNDHGRSSCKLLLLGFDMADEVFKEIMLPESLSNAVNRSQSRLYVLSHGESSSIAVIESCVRGNCSIWIMKKYSVVETWTKMFSFEKIENRCFPRILGFRKNGGLLLRTSEVSQQLKISNEIENLEIHGRFSYIFSYVESLVLLDQVIDARGENGTKNVSKASNSIKGATNDFTKSAA
ncbi:F-box domain - like 10, partial [Theobroma cacao]